MTSMGTGKMNKPTIGVDVSKDHLDACRWPDGEGLRVTNDAAGHRRLLRWIGGEVARVAFEATGAYHAGFERALHRADVPCSKLNPARVRRFAEAIGTNAKTDRVDARLIARMAAMLEPRPQAPAPAILAELHELQLARTALIRERTAATNRAGRLTLALLKRQHATRLRQIERALAELDAAIAALIASDAGLARKAEILCSIPGVSLVTAAALLAEMPELGSLEAGAAASLTGLAPFTRESGTWKGQARIGGGRGDLRRALYLPALSAARFNPDMKAVYDRLRANGKPAKVALVALMRKLVILANVLLRNDRTWQSRA
jgi:transposase